MYFGFRTLDRKYLLHTMGCPFRYPASSCLRLASKLACVNELTEAKLAVGRIELVDLDTDCRFFTSSRLAFGREETVFD